MELVIINKHSWSKELGDIDVKDNGQGTIKVTDENRHLLTEYIKYTSAQVAGLDFSSGHLNPCKITQQQVPNPFASKKLDTGEKLYKRKHGQKYTMSAGANDIVFTIPYTHVKITGIEVLGCETLDWVDFCVTDSTTGTYTGVPDYLLNQFGYGVYLPYDYYKDENSYDADLYGGMQIKIHYYSRSAKDVGINFNLHEVKK